MLSYPAGYFGGSGFRLIFDTVGKEKVSAVSVTGYSSERMALGSSALTHFFFCVLTKDINISSLSCIAVVKSILSVVEVSNEVDCISMPEWSAKFTHTHTQDKLPCGPDAG